MEFDYSVLRGKIKEVFGTQDKFAEAMGLSTVSISFKLNGKVEWTQNEMKKACILLGVPLEFLTVLFFSKKVKTSELTAN